MSRVFRYSRRQLILRAAACGVGLLSLMTRSLGRSSEQTRKPTCRAAPHTLSASEIKTLEALGETLLPGTRLNGIARYVDVQLSVDPRYCMLMLKYLRAS